MIRYHVFSPHGNVTAILTKVEVKHAELASSIMEADRTIEQVGFVEAADANRGAFMLHMMGDEFCANAALSSALFWNSSEHQSEFEFSTSGLSKPIRASVTGTIATLKFSPSLVKGMREIPEGRLIDLEGIRFVISENTRTQKEIEAILDGYDEPAIPAIGFLCAQPHEAGMSITPWVRVRDTGTTIAESACASGSIALAAHLRQSSGASEVLIRQPSGAEIRVQFSSDGSLSFSGEAPYLGERSLSRPVIS